MDNWGDGVWDGLGWGGIQHTTVQLMPLPPAKASITSVVPVANPIIGGVVVRVGIGYNSLVISVGLSGAAGVGQVGVVSRDTEVDLGSVSAITKVGGVTPTGQYDILGVSASSKLEPLGSGDIIYNATVDVGSVHAVGGIGVVETPPMVYYDVSGVSAAVGIGAVGVTLAAKPDSIYGSVYNNGVSLMGTYDLTGVSAQAKMGTAKAACIPTIDSLSAKGSIGSIDFTISSNIEVAGVVSQVKLGLVGATHIVTVEHSRAVGSVGDTNLIIDRQYTVEGVRAKGKIGPAVGSKLSARWGIPNWGSYDWGGAGYVDVSLDPLPPLKGRVGQVSRLYPYDVVESVSAKTHIGQNGVVVTAIVDEFLNHPISWGVMPWGEDVWSRRAHLAGVGRIGNVTWVNQTSVSLPSLKARVNFVSGVRISLEPQTPPLVISAGQIRRFGWIVEGAA